MRIRAVGSRGYDLPEEILDKSHNMPQARFHVTVGKVYDVHAMALWRSGLGVLIVDDTGAPNWKPVALFQVEDHSLPAHWKFTTVDGADVFALWGYPSMIHDESHHDALIERRRAALDVFLRETSGTD